MGTTGNRVCVCAYRGFESLSLRLVGDDDQEPPDAIRAQAGLESLQEVVSCVRGADEALIEDMEGGGACSDAVFVHQL